MSQTPITEIEKTFRQVFFHASYPNVRTMPPADMPEVAFIGRSNSGKSTLLNGLCYQKSLARSGKTPGLTRAINVFSWLPPSLPAPEGEESKEPLIPASTLSRVQWIDLPGYGYAKMSHGEAAAVARVLVDYLQNRTALKAVVLIIDPRRGVLSMDEEVLSLLPAYIHLAIVHSKIDKLSRNELPQLRKKTEVYLKTQGYGFAETKLFFSSSMPNSREGAKGLNDLRQWLYGFALPSTINTSP